MFPSNYTPPASTSDGSYTKIPEGELVRLRILSDAVVGYVYWSNDNKPVRSLEPFTTTPNIRENDKPKHFWAFKVYNYNTEKIEVWEITQASIRKTLWTLWEDTEDYGDLRNYGLKITRTGSKLETKYEVIAVPPKPLDEAIAQLSADTPVDLTALFRDESPFAKDDGSKSGSADDDF
jgi:hypothetical protein